MCVYLRAGFFFKCKHRYRVVRLKCLPPGTSVVEMKHLLISNSSEKKPLGNVVLSCSIQFHKVVNLEPLLLENASAFQEEKK